MSIGAAGGGGSGSVMSGYAMNSKSMNSGILKVEGSLELSNDSADIKINTKSMKEWMEAVEKRLAILQPDPKLLKKYEALQQAYDHYKTLEAMLYDESK